MRRANRVVQPAALARSRNDRSSSAGGEAVGGASISRGATLVDTSDRDGNVKNASVGVHLDRDRFARVLIDSVRALDIRKGTGH